MPVTFRVAALAIDRVPPVPSLLPPVISQTAPPSTLKSGNPLNVPPTPAMVPATDPLANSSVSPAAPPPNAPPISTAPGDSCSRLPFTAANCTAAVVPEIVPCTSTVLATAPLASTPYFPPEIRAAWPVSVTVPPARM